MNRMGNRRFQKREMKVTRGDNRVKGYGCRPATSFLLNGWALKGFEVGLRDKANLVESVVCSGAGHFN